MNKIKGSIFAKVIAWILLILSGFFFVMSCITTVFMENYSVFRLTRDAVLEEQFANISNTYSVMAINHYREGLGDDYFSDKAFRYGIIEAESPDGIDLNKESSYLHRNFTDTVSRENLYVFPISLSEDTRIMYSDDLFGSYGYSTGLVEDRTLYADRICYDIAEGIFYYRADGNYYPAESVSIRVSLQAEETVDISEYYSFQYDNEKKKYRIGTNQVDIAEEIVLSPMDEVTYIYEENRTAQAIGEENAETHYVPSQTEGAVDMGVQENPDRTSDQLQVLIGSKEMEILQSEDEITFNVFDGTALAYSEWGQLLFDDFREIDASELLLIDSSAIGKNRFMEVDKSYLDENYTLHVVDKSTEKNYLIVSYIDKATLAAQKQAFLRKIQNNSPGARLEAVISAEGADLYVLMEILVDTLFEWKESIIVVMFGMFFLAVESFVFLICAAGHRRKKEEIVPTFVDKIPLDFFCIVVFMIEGIAGCVLVEISYSDSATLIFQMFSAIGMMMACVLMVTLLSFAVRVKMGKWWRNSVIYWIFAKARNMCQLFWYNRGMLWKLLAVVAVETLAVIFLGCCMGVGEEIATFKICELIIILPVLVVLVLQLQKLQEGSRMIAEGNLQQKIDTTKMFWEFKKNAENLNRIGDGMSSAVEERMKSERFKTELITNVSHDIKTPLTSIINYVDLLEKTDIQDETAKEYLEVLERQSARLKKLIEDLIEASKASTGNLSVSMEALEANVFVTQILGEFEEKLAGAGLELIITKPEEEIPVKADGRHLWRVVDNLMNNICKYAQPGSRVYINLEQTQDKILLTFKNMSKYPLNITSEELMERFVRGDSSRNTEGNGLGLSIAKSLMELMNGQLLLFIDGDLFKVVLEFPR